MSSVLKGRSYACLTLTFIILSLVPAMADAKFDVCLAEIQSGKFGNAGATDSHGCHISNISETKAITYDLCIAACGSDPEPFDWSVFSQQFSSWLLPWLALVSQLPFGANDNLDNLVSTILTVGSPTLAAYSLALTAINGRWIARLFAPYSYPNATNALKVLSSLQQSPVKINTSNTLLASLVVLHENDKWWGDLVELLNYTHTWSISAVTSISWVVIAYIFTVIDSFTSGVTTSINANGEGVGSLWLWLLPVVAGWLQISPKCDSRQLHETLKRVNEFAYVAGDHARPTLTSQLSEERGFSLATDRSRDFVQGDEVRTPPIYNYARFLPWVRTVEIVSEMFHAASEHARLHKSVDTKVEWKAEGKNYRPSNANRTGTRAQVMEYVSPLTGEIIDRKPSYWGRNVWSRVFLASIIALSLQWGTTGAAIVVVWFTPTIGLGCRSGAYLLYGCLSTVVWAMLVLSSFLAHYATDPGPCISPFKHRIAAKASITLRRTGKLTAAINTLWIVASCLFQFSNFFNRCYCNSSVLGWGKNAFDVLQVNHDDVVFMTRAWVGGIILAAGSAAVFMVFIKLFINPSQVTQE